VDMWYEVYEGGEIDPIWAYDSVEFLVDGDHSGGEYGFHPDCCATQEEWQQVQNSQAQQYYVINQSPRDPLVKYAGVGLWVNRPPYADVGGMREFVSRRVDKWVGQQHRIVTEFYVTPFDSLAWDSPQASKVSPLFANKVIGFSLAVADLDTPIGYNDGHGFHSLYTGSSATWRNADYFVDGLLVEAPAPATVVEGWSWGRIKAAFGFEDGE